MAAFEKFHYQTLEQLKAEISALGLELPLSEDLSPLAQSVRVGNRVAPNSIAVLPMEGCDSALDGTPSDLVMRRYRRFAAGGAGLLWFEACAVTPEGRANELQMAIHEGDLDVFRALIEQTRATAQERCGHRPLTILQLTHSGRYSRPVGHAPAPVIVQHDPLLDPPVGLGPDSPVATDEYLEGLIPKFVKAALLAQEAGFDGVDIKACHRYLLSELLGAFERPGKYGGSFENRTRLLLEIVDAVKAAVRPDLIVACRLNVYDAHPYPSGFGVDKADFRKPDLAEPVKLAKLLAEHGVELLCVTAGNPYYSRPYVGRPFDAPVLGAAMPDEHPLEGCARLYALAAEIAAAVDIPVVGTGYSYLRQYLPYAGAANIAAGRARFMGLGRESFAYPDAPLDILRGGAMDAKKVCISCSKCTQIMRDHGRTGCVVRDAAQYAPMYKEYRREAELRANSKED